MLEGIKGLSVLELNELVKLLEEEFGVSAAAPVTVASVQGVDASAAQVDVEEQTEFSVTLQDIGPNKINVIIFKLTFNFTNKIRINNRF